MKRLLHALYALILMASGALASPATDGWGGGYNLGGSSVSASLTTSNSNDLVFAFYFSSLPGSTGPNLSSVTATGLTFTQLYAVNSGRHRLEVWVAQASGTLSSKTITATAGSAWDAAGLHVVGVSGAASSSYNDTGGGVLPNESECSSPGGHCQPTGTLTTTKANDLIFVWQGCSTIVCMGNSTFNGANSTCDSVNNQPSGYTQLGCTYGFNSQSANTALGYKQVSSAQSGVSIVGRDTTYGETMVILAVTADGPAGGGGGFLLLGAGR